MPLLQTLKELEKNGIPRSLKNRCAFFVSLHFFVPKICMFMLFAVLGFMQRLSNLLNQCHKESTAIF